MNISDLLDGTPEAGVAQEAPGPLARAACMAALGFARHYRPAQTGRPLLDDVEFRDVLIGSLADAFALSCAARAARQREIPGDQAVCHETCRVEAELLKAVTFYGAERVIELCAKLSTPHSYIDSTRMHPWGGWARLMVSVGGDALIAFREAGAAFPCRDVDDIPYGWWPYVLAMHAADLAAGESTFHDRASVWAEILVCEAVREVMESLDAETHRLLKPLVRLYEARRAKEMAADLMVSGVLRPQGVRELRSTASELCGAIAKELSEVCELLKPKVS